MDPFVPFLPGNAPLAYRCFNFRTVPLEFTRHKATRSREANDEEARSKSESEKTQRATPRFLGFFWAFSCGHDVFPGHRLLCPNLGPHDSGAATCGGTCDGSTCGHAGTMPSQNQGNYEERRGSPASPCAVQTKRFFRAESEKGLRKPGFKDASSHPVPAGLLLSPALEVQSIHSFAGEKMRTDAFTVLIAEDDPVQLEQLSNMVRRLRPDWRIVAEVRSSVELERALENLDPSLAILDVHFSGKTALEILRGMQESCPVIFVTGDPTCAAEAYSCDVLDLVVKPVTPERLERALRKVEAFIAAQSGGQSGGASHGTSSAEPLLISSAFGVLHTPLSEVRYFQAQRKYTRVVLKDQEGLLREGISSLMPKLNGSEFWRIHRGLILNLSHMKVARRDELGRLMVHLRDRDEKLPVSRPHEDLFREGFPRLFGRH